MTPETISQIQKLLDQNAANERQIAALLGIVEQKIPPQRCDGTLCSDIGEPCMQPQSNGSNFLCTRTMGHDGPHIACAGAAHNLSIWEDEP